jgi:hypothetical protein
MTKVTFLQKRLAQFLTQPRSAKNVVFCLGMFCLTETSSDPELGNAG